MKLWKSYKDCGKGNHTASTENIIQSTKERPFFPNPTETKTESPFGWAEASGLGA